MRLLPTLVKSSKKNAWAEEKEAEYRALTQLRREAMENPDGVVDIRNFATEVSSLSPIRVESFLDV